MTPSMKWRRCCTKGRKDTKFRIGGVVRERVSYSIVEGDDAEGHEDGPAGEDEDLALH